MNRLRWASPASPVAADVTWLPAVGTWLGLVPKGASHPSGSLSICIALAGATLQWGRRLPEWKPPWGSTNGSSACFLFAHKASCLAHPWVKVGGAAQEATIWRTTSPTAQHRDQAPLTHGWAAGGKGECSGQCGGHGHEHRPQ